MLTIVKACYVNNHIIALTFSDGYSRHVDFAPFIFTVDHPDYVKYQTPQVFSKFSLREGNIDWDDYTMIFPIEDLYANTLSSPSVSAPRRVK